MGIPYINEIKISIVSIG